VTEHYSRAATVFIVCVSVVAVVGCDDGGGGSRTSQLVSSPSTSLPVSVSPFQLQLTPVPLAGCTATQPFTTHFDLVLGPTTVDLVVDAVTLRVGGNNGPGLFFLSDDLQRLFGRTDIPARTNRTFTLQPDFGCGLPTTPGSLAVTVTAVDRQGQQHQGTATVSFR